MFVLQCVSFLVYSLACVLDAFFVIYFLFFSSQFPIVFCQSLRTLQHYSLTRSLSTSLPVRSVSGEHTLNTNTHTHTYAEIMKMPGIFSVANKSNYKLRAYVDVVIWLYFCLSFTRHCTRCSVYTPLRLAPYPTTYSFCVLF